MENNIIKISNSKIIDDVLFINEKAYDYGDLIEIFRTKEEYESQESSIQLVSSHYEGKLAYVADSQLFLVGGDIDDLSDQLYDTDGSNGNNFEEFIKKISVVAVKPFVIAAKCWEGIGIGVYYLMFDDDFKSIRLGVDEWEETELFIDLANTKGYDMESDDFYDEEITNQDGRTQCMEIYMEIYDMLSSNPELLKPEKF